MLSQGKVPPFDLQTAQQPEQTGNSVKMTKLIGTRGLTAT